MMKAGDINSRSGHVVDAAMRVHSALGPGLLEGAYEACLAHELRKRGFSVQVQFPLPVTYDGVQIELGYRADLLVDNAVLVELKAVAKLLPVHHAQLLSYLEIERAPGRPIDQFSCSAFERRHQTNGQQSLNATSFCRAD